MDLQTVVVGWRKGMMSAAHTYALEVVDGRLWLGRLGKGGANWQPDAGTPYASLRTEGQTIGSHKVGVDIGMAAGRKVLDRFAAEIDERARRYAAEGRTALGDDRHTGEWPLSEVGDVGLVDKLPGGAPPAMKALGPGFVAASIAGKQHYFAGVEGAMSAAGLQAALSTLVAR